MAAHHLHVRIAILSAIIFFSASLAVAATNPGYTPQAYPELQRYFEAQCKEIDQQSRSILEDVEGWKSRKSEYRRQLQEMLGLWPMPERTDLKPVITGKIDEPEFIVEKLHFQASPGLYVTANLYIPRGLDRPAPAILYVCGHSRVVTNGLSYGNKTGYQHHGAWFARHGYVCLTIDTLQLGEIQGVHHGTHTQNQWWWNSRGYTPAGVEAWFGIRALDYLCTRPEVDPAKIGMTGRSGGGAYTWTVAALDDRVQVAVPVAGITDLRNQVADGVVDGHCDCMFHLNSYRWDFPMLAALIAPRPLLIANSDKDTIFPLDGVVRLHEQVRKIYSGYRASTNLGLLITEGPHLDTQDLQVPAFRWFDRFLRGEQRLIERAAVKMFSPLELKALESVPKDQINTFIQDSFVPSAEAPGLQGPELARLLRQKVFTGWPKGEPAPEFLRLATVKEKGLTREDYHLVSQECVNLRMILLRAGKRSPSRGLLHIVSPEEYARPEMRDFWNGYMVVPDTLREQIRNENTALVFLIPRLADTLPAENSRVGTQIRRRFMLLGQTLDGMRVWDIRCGLVALRSMAGWNETEITLKATGAMGVNAQYAALFEPWIKELTVLDCPQSPLDHPDYLNLLRYTRGLPRD